MESVDSIVSKVYTWGMDLSGSMQGAGGVGGLLSVTEISSDPNATHDSVSYYPTYDGNGNVSEYLDENGATVAHYEYDSFGNTTKSTGAKANDFAHRFSTKPLENETGFYYYGYRYYNPVTGTWPNRDPIQEQGGTNLYGFIGNNPISQIDMLGMRAVRLNASAFRGSSSGGNYSSRGRYSSMRVYTARQLQIKRSLYAARLAVFQANNSYNSGAGGSSSFGGSAGGSSSAGGGISLPNFSGKIGFVGSIGIYTMPAFPAPGLYIQLKGEKSFGSCCDKASGEKKSYSKWQGTFTGGIHYGSPGVKTKGWIPITENLKTCPESKELDCKGILSASIRLSVWTGNCSWSYGSGWSCGGGIRLSLSDAFTGRISVGGGVTCSITEVY